MWTYNKYPLIVAACSGAALLALVMPVHAEVAGSPAAAPAQSGSHGAAPPSPPAPVCGAPRELTRFVHPLTHMARRLATGAPLIIVAVGSSSTYGAGATSPAANYPSRLAVELKQRFPGHDITVLNRGVNGEETAQMLGRFATGVLAEHPDLVVWQVGTNSVMRDHSLPMHAVLLREGIAELKKAGADVVLMDMQYVPKVLAKSEAQGMEDQLAMAAKQENVDLFERFAIMRNWHEVQHIPFDAFAAPDQLHMNDWGYGCVAKLLADAIAEAATRPVASAARAGH
jgi:lysophospholipase L1-like esterase